MIASAWKGSSSTSSRRIMSGPGANAGFGAGCIAIGGRSADGRRAWLATAFRSWRFCFFDELSDASDLASSDARIWQRLSHSMSSGRQPRHLARLPCSCSVAAARSSTPSATRRRRRTATLRSCEAGQLRDRGLSSSVRWLGDASTLGARAVCIFGGCELLRRPPRAAWSERGRRRRRERRPPQATLTPSSGGAV